MGASSSMALREMELASQERIAALTSEERKEITKMTTESREKVESMQNNLILESKNIEAKYKEMMAELNLKKDELSITKEKIIRHSENLSTFMTTTSNPAKIILFAGLKLLETQNLDDEGDELVKNVRDILTTDKVLS